MSGLYSPEIFTGCGSEGVNFLYFCRFFEPNPHGYSLHKVFLTQFYPPVSPVSHSMLPPCVCVCVCVCAWVYVLRGCVVSVCEYIYIYKD